MPYAVTQRQTGTIYGVGATKAAAVRNANEWLERGGKTTLKALEAGRPEYGDLTIEHATQGVVRYVKEMGGADDGGFRFYDGKLTLTNAGKERLARTR